MDGANRLQVFFLIMLPLMAPVLFVGSVILLISVWGDEGVADRQSPAN
jgi:raffinose/stachyose/melibiose transport system permease protein